VFPDERVPPQMDSDGFPEKALAMIKQQNPIHDWNCHRVLELELQREL
jgi:hypothetical protein